jgi:anti-sigma factor RsiW
VAPNRDMIDAFVDGRLSADDHDLMVHHISSCSECAAAVIGALAEAARALAADSADRAAAGADQVPLFDERAEPGPVPDLLQLDLILDRAHDRSSELLLRVEPIEEVSLEQLAQPPGFAGARAAHMNGAVMSVEVAVPLAAAEARAPLPDMVEEVGLAEAEVGPVVADPVEPGPVTEVAGVATAEPESAAPQLLSPQYDQDASPASADVESITAESGERLIAIPSVAESLTAAPAADAPAVPRRETPGDAPIASGPERDYRIPDDERAAIVEAVRGHDAAPRARTRRWSLIAAAALSLVAFGAFASFAAVQLREFASLDDGEGLRQATPTPAIQAPALAHDAAPPASVLAALLDSTAVGTVVLAEGGSAETGADSAADSVGAAAASMATSDPREGEPVAPAPAAGIAPAPPRRPVGVIRPADQPDPQLPSPAATATAAAARASGALAVADTARSRAADTAGGRTLPHLLRTTTHRARADVDYVLREYEAAGPEPPPRPGINEFRWRNTAGTRLFVLSGPGTVAELRAYARWLRGL